MIETIQKTKNRQRLLGVPVDAIDSDSLNAYLQELLQSNGSHQIVFLRTMDLMRARRNPEFKACLENAALVVPVSKNLQNACEKLHLPTLTRFAPFDFIIRLLNVLESKRMSFYLLGDRQPYLNRTELNLKQTFPGAQSLGRYPSSFSKNMEKNIIIAIAKAAPNLLLAGNGLTGKALWIHRRRNSFPRGVQVWCGECYEYFTGRKKRPNRIAFRKGREYYRESKGKPWRVFWFPIIAYFHFLVLLERIKRPIGTKN